MTQQTDNTSTSQDGSQQQQAAGGGSSDGSQQQTQQTQNSAPQRPAEFADKAFDTYWDNEKGLKHADLARDFNGLRADKAAADLRKAGVPAKPDEYKLALPQTLELPKGPDGKPIPYEFNESDPRLAPVREFAHKSGLDQAGFSELLAIHAQYEIGEMQQINAAREAEVGKLGANGPARVDAVTRFLTATIGSESGEAIMARMVLSTDLAAMESLMQKFTSQGGGSFTQQHREKPTNKLTEDEYQKLPLSERWTYQLGQRKAS